ncbi:acyl-CoA dehydrogenase, partial [bacterium]
KLAGVVLSGWQMARAALAADELLKAGDGDAEFLASKIATARFHADHLLTQAGALLAAATEGAAGVLAMPETAF